MREELAAAERELRQRTSQAQSSDGEEVIRGDEVHCCSYFHNLKTIQPSNICHF